MTRLIETRPPGARLTAIAATIVAVAAAGCQTQLQATKVSGSSQSVVGQVYTLSRVDFSLNVERELKECHLGFENTAVAVLEWLRDQSVPISRMTNEDEIRHAHAKLVSDPILRSPGATALAEPRLPLDWRERSFAERLVEDPQELADAVKVKTTEQRALLQLVMDVEMRAQATPLVLPDPDHVYAIQYEGMREFLKGTNYSVETYPSGILKGINVTLDDQTGHFIKTTLQGAAKIAAISGGFPLSAGAGLQGAEVPQIQSFSEWNLPPLCNAVTTILLMQRETLSAQARSAEKRLGGQVPIVAALEKEIVGLESQLEERKAELAAMPEGDARKPDLTLLIKKLTAQAQDARKLLDDAKKTQQSLAASSSRVVAELATIRKALTVSSVSHFSPTRGAGSAMELGGAAGAMQAWLDPLGVARYCQRSQACTDDWPDGAIEKLRVTAATYPAFTQLSGLKDPIGAVVYRQPMRALLLVCTQAPCLNEGGEIVANSERILLSAPVDVPQLGVLAALPLHNGAFQNNTLTASFSQTGALAKLAYVSNAKASGTADAFSASADTILQYQQAKREDQKKKLEATKAEVDASTQLLQAQLEQERAQRELEAFRAGETPQTSPDVEPTAGE